MGRALYQWAWQEPQLPARCTVWDMEESLIEIARSVAASQRQDNAIFHVGDVTDLKFEAASSTSLTAAAY